MAIMIGGPLLAAPYVLGIRGNEASTASFANANALPLAKEKSQEFDNGNTYVQVSENILNRDAFIVLPEKMSSNQLMEALIKIRTANANGAQSVFIVSAVPIEDISFTDLKQNAADLGLESLFKISGGTQVKEGKSKFRDITDSKIKSPVLGTKSPSIIVDENIRSVSKETSERNNTKYFNFINSSEILKGGNVVYFFLNSNASINPTLFDSIAKIRQSTKQGNQIHLVTPYLPYARSDKIDQPGTIVTARLIADLFESSGISAITFCRAHSPQAQGYYHVPSFQLSGRPTLNRYLKDHQIEMIVSPDAGFQKDATLYAEELGIPVAVINKVRNGNKVEVKGISGAPVLGKKIAIIDDETASGSTLAKAADLLHALGATEIYALVTHLTGDAKAAIENPNIKEIAFTDSLENRTQKNPKVVVLSLVDEFSEHLKSLERGRKEERCDVILQRLNSRP